MKAILIAFLLLFFFARPAFAVTVAITNYPSAVGIDSFLINVSILGASPGTNFIRVDFYKDGTSNYFGETFNNSDWYSGSDGKQYFPITIIDSKSTASASLQTRIGSPNSNEYNGPGAYRMRVRRYTNSGGQGSEDPMLSSVPININIPTNTLTPTISPTFQPTSTSIPTPTLSPTSTKIPTITVSKNISPTDILDIEVLSESTKSSGNKVENPKKDSQVDKSQKTDNTLIPKILILVGIVFLLACAIVIAYPYIQAFVKEKNNG